MKKILWLTCTMLAMALWLSTNSLRQAKAERDRLRNNSETLLGDIERYKTQDSLNVARLQSLRLTIDEYKRYRSEDLALIEELKMKGRDLSGVATTNTHTHDTIWTQVRDTLIQRDSVRVNGQCVDISKPFLELHGCIVEGEFIGDIHTYDSLLVVESIKRKRLLGFLWKTKKIKDKRIDIFSRNPRTTIASAEVVTIEY